MAEFCLDCWNKINNTNDSKNKYIMSRDLEFCEGCGEWKKVIVMERNIYDSIYTFPFILIYKTLYCLYKIIIFLYKYLKIKFKKTKS